MSGGGGSTTSTSTSVNYSPEEAAKRAAVMSEAERIYGATAPTISTSAYPGAKPVGFDPATIAAQNSLMGNAQALNPSIANLMKSVNFSLRDVLYPESNPALQAYMQAATRPITQSYMDPGGIMSQIRTQAGEANQVGSSRQGVAEGIAAGRYAQALGDTSAKVANEGYAQGLNAMGRAQTLAPQSFQTMMLPAEMMGAVGAQREALGQSWEDYMANSRMWGLNAPWTPLQNYANIVFGGASPGTSTTAQGMGGASTASRIAGAGLTGLGTYGMLAMNPATAGVALPAAALMGVLGLL